MKRIESRETTCTHKATTRTNASNIECGLGKSDHEGRPILRSNGWNSKRKITCKWERFARACR